MASSITEYDAPINIEGLKFSGFKNEREMCDYLENNVKLFTQDILNKDELPITVVLMNKDILATWDKEWSTQWQDQQ